MLDIQKAQLAFIEMGNNRCKEIAMSTSEANLKAMEADNAKFGIELLGYDPNYVTDVLMESNGWEY